MTPITCSDCREAIDDPAESWPDGGDGRLCQMCWEALAARYWWATLRQITGHPDGGEGGAP